jgi:hypothetical protein
VDPCVPLLFASRRRADKSVAWLTEANAVSNGLTMGSPAFIDMAMQRTATERGSAALEPPQEGSVNTLSTSMLTACRQIAGWTKPWTQNLFFRRIPRVCCCLYLARAVDVVFPSVCLCLNGLCRARDSNSETNCTFPTASRVHVLAPFITPWGRLALLSERC